MHRVDIWPNAKRLKSRAPCSEQCLALGYGKPQLLVYPQIKGSGYGLTVTDMTGHVLLEADLTAPATPTTTILQHAKRTKYRTFLVKGAARKTP